MSSIHLALTDKKGVQISLKFRHGYIVYFPWPFSVSKIQLQDDLFYFAPKLAHSLTAITDGPLLVT
jgi:hypothetical protein